MRIELYTTAKHLTPILPTSQQQAINDTDGSAISGVELSVIGTARALWLYGHDVYIYNPAMDQAYHMQDYRGIPFYALRPEMPDVTIAVREPELCAIDSPRVIFQCHDFDLRPFRCFPNDIVVISRDLQNRLGVDWPDPLYCPLAVDTDMFAPKRKNPNRIIASGQIAESKGVGRVCDVLSELYLKKDFRFDYFGSASMWGTAPRQADKEVAEAMSELADNCQWLAHEEYAQQLADAGIYISLSDGETFGLAVVEAMAAGCVPVVSKVRGHIEHVFHTFNGISHAPDAIDLFVQDISALMHNPKRQLALSQRARLTALRRYSLKAVGACWNRILDDDAPSKSVAVGVLSCGEDVSDLMDSIVENEKVDHTALVVNGAIARKDCAYDEMYSRPVQVFTPPNNWLVSKSTLVTTFRHYGVMVLMDADVELHDGWLDVILKTFDNHPLADAVTFRSLIYGDHDFDGGYHGDIAVVTEYANTLTAFRAEVFDALPLPRFLHFYRPDTLHSIQMTSLGMLMIAICDEPGQYVTHHEKVTARRRGGQRDIMISADLEMYNHFAVNFAEMLHRTTPIENINALYPIAPISHSEATIWDKGMQILDDDCRFLDELIARGNISSVLEFGSGRSTDFFLQRGVDLVTVEAHKAYYERACVLWGSDSIILNEWDAEKACHSHFDLGFVDSPGWTRSDDLILASKLCRYVILHDARQAIEQRISQKLGVGGWKCSFIDTQRGMFFFEKGEG